METLTVLDQGERVPLAACTPVPLRGTCLYRAPDGRLLAPAFRSTAVDLGATEPPTDGDEEGLSALVLRWVEVVRARDWSDERGAPLADDGWIDLRTAMTRVGWGPAAAADAWERGRARPYARDLPTAAGWAAAGWVVPAVPDEPEPAFARPVIEERGLLRWAYIDRWASAAALPDAPLPAEPEPAGAPWADVLSRLRQDHHTERSLAEAADLALGVLRRAGLGAATDDDADDELLGDAELEPACSHPSPLVRAAAWFVLYDEAERWLACTYAECQHHWAVAAEEDAYELDEVLEFAGHGVTSPVDAAYQRRRLLTLAFGDVTDVPLAGAGDVDHFLAFYREWVAGGRSEEEFQRAAESLRGDAGN